MDKALNNYLRQHRRNAPLTQTELAALLGLECRSSVSRLEWSVTRPSLEIALACHFVFDAPIEELFPGPYADSLKQVIDRATILSADRRERITRPVEVRDIDQIEHLIVRLNTRR